MLHWWLWQMYCVRNSCLQLSAVRHTHALAFAGTCACCTCPSCVAACACMGVGLCLRPVWQNATTCVQSHAARSIVGINKPPLHMQQLHGITSAGSAQHYVAIRNHRDMASMLALPSSLALLSTRLPFSTSCPPAS